MAYNLFTGAWEVVSCQQPSNNSETEKYGIEGTIFQLDDTGDVTWIPSEGAHNIPLLSCETYEIYSPSLNNLVFRFGAYAGHVIELRADDPVSREVLKLKCDGWCTLLCRRKPDDQEPLPDAPFSLLPALEDGYFSDLSISASSGKQFSVHSTILALSAPDIDSNELVPSLTGLPEDVLSTVLHYLYSECLPKNLSEATAHSVATAVTPLPSRVFTNLARSCELFIRNIALKQQIVTLVSDMHACAAQIIEHFGGLKNSSNSSHNSTVDGLRSNPAKLCHAVKQSVREAAVACVKLLVLCDLFTKRKMELSNNERLEIIRYAKSRLPFFMSQLQSLLQVIKSTLSGLSTSQRYDIATYLVPETESILDTISDLALEVKSAMEQIIHVLATSDSKSSYDPGEILTRSLNNVLSTKEVNKLRRFYHWMTFNLTWLLQRKENFNEMTSPNKVRSVARNLEQLMEELPIFLLRMQEVDDKLEWREFKFCFKVGTSKVSGWIQVLLGHKEVLQDVLSHVCDLVQRDEFTKSLSSLGLLDPTHNATSSGSGQPPRACSTPKHHGGKLSLVESLCTPLPSRKSQLAIAALPLLKSGRDSDMVFEIVSSQEMDSVFDQTSGLTIGSGPEAEEEIHTMSAHRVIVAARCEWFRRALQSGMREAIDRKIIIHDTNPLLFSLFLEYLYSGSVNARDLSVEQLADLMMLGDRYEVETLKQICEQALKAHIDNDSVLYFLSLADQFNAKQLKSSCLTYVSHHTEIMDSDIFQELPQNLQAEIYDLIIWVKPSKSETENLVSCTFPILDTSRSSSMADLEDVVASLRISSHGGDRSQSSSLEDLPLAQDSARLETCIQELMDIVGEEVTRQELIQLALAADYDVNRAANFYYERRRVA